MLRIGIVGAGTIADTQIDCFRNFADISEVVALCGRTLDKPKALIELKNLKANPYDDMEKMIEAERLDIVSICLPPTLHAEYSIKAMDMGCHVICEKPMAASLEECDRMLEAAKRNHVLLSIVCQMRYYTQFARLKKLLDDGVAGKVINAEIQSLWWRGGNYYEPWWRGTWEKESGGCFMSHSIHYLDLMLHLLGYPKRVTGRIMNLNHNLSECEDNGYGFFEFEDFPVLFTCCLTDHSNSSRIRIDCEKATVSAPWSVGCSDSLPTGYPTPNHEREREIDSYCNSLPEMEGEWHTAQFRNFLNAVLGKERLETPGEDGRRALEMVMGIYFSSITGKPVDFPLGKDNPIYTHKGIVENMPKMNL